MSIADILDINKLCELNGDGVHQNRIMLMTPTGNNNTIPVGVFYDKERGYFMAISLAVILLLGLPVKRMFEKLDYLVYSR
mgnify:CR=1 FL=1